MKFYLNRPLPELRHTQPTHSFAQRFLSQARIPITESPFTLNPQVYFSCSASESLVVVLRESGDSLKKECSVPKGLTSFFSGIPLVPGKRCSKQENDNFFRFSPH